MTAVPDGSTRVIGVVGDPIAQVKGPQTWSALFRANGVNALCLPLHVRPAGLAAFLQGMHALENLDGLIVTIPHKPATLGLVTGATDRARRVGSVNVLRRDVQGAGWFGDILDGVGFVAGLTARGQSVTGKRALVVGTGGAGRAIAFAIAEAGAAEVVVSDLDGGRAGEVADGINAGGTPSRVGRADPTGFDLVVNATPMGMRPGDPVSIPVHLLESSMVVADVVVRPEMTALLSAAQQRGCFVQPGKHMMNNQVAMIAGFFGFEQGEWDRDAIERLADH